MKHPNILKYMGLLQKKTYAHLLAIQKVILEEEKKTQKPCLQDDLEYADLLENNTYLKALKNKEKTLNTSNIFTKQELLELNQTIQNYALTLKALTIVRDDLLPVMETEYTSITRKKKQKQTMEIHTSTMQLCQNLLLRNANAANIYLTKLKQASSREFSMTKIEYDVNAYFNQLQSANALLPQNNLTNKEESENPLKHILKQ